MRRKKNKFKRLKQEYKPKRIVWPSTRLELPKLPAEVQKMLSRKYDVSLATIYRWYREQKDLDFIKEAIALALATQREKQTRDAAVVAKLLTEYVKVNDPMHQVYRQVRNLTNDEDFLADEEGEDETPMY